MDRNSGHSRIRVLAVTSDRDFRRRLEPNLDAHGSFHVTSTTTVGEAIELLQSGVEPDCLISDHHLPDTDGVAFLQAVRAHHPTLPFVLFTASGDEETASRAISANVTEYLIKTREEDQWERLAGIVRKAVAYHRAYGRTDDPTSRIEAVLDSTFDTIAIVRDGRIEYVNRPGVELVGADSRGDVLGRPIDSLLDAVDGRIRARLGAVQRGEQALERLDGTVWRFDGIAISIEATATPVEWDGSPAVVLVVRDVDERREYETQLRRLQRAIEAAGHAVYLTDTDGIITYVNPAFEEITGYGADRAIGKTPALFASGEMSDDYYESLWETIERGDVWNERITNRRASGERYHAQQTIAPVFDGHDVERFVAIQTDITGRVETERRLEQYRKIVELLDDPILLQDLEGEFTVLNEAAAEFAGYSRDALLGADESAFMDPETTATIERRKADVLETETAAAYEVSPSFGRTGVDATFSTKRYPYYDDDGLAGTLAICRNVTELKDRERTLRRYEWAIRGATDLIAAVDRDERYLFANPQYRSYHGIDSEDVTALRLADVIDEDAYADVADRIDRALAGETVRHQTTRSHPTHGERILDAQYYPLADGDDVTGVVAVFRDVTESEERARQLRVVDRILRHNLRNDLTVIRGLAERLGANATDADAACANRILDAVDGLLTTSQKSRGITRVLNEQPTPEAVDVAAAVRTVAGSVAERHPDARVEVTAPETAVVSSLPHVHEAIEELAVNAVVHSDRETPQLSLSVAREGDDGVTVRIVDDGPGIAEMDRSVLENGEEIDDLYHGSGLGLWLVHWIVHRSGGTATVDDLDPRGSEVTLTFTRRPA